MTVLAADPEPQAPAKTARRPSDESLILLGVGLLALGTYLWQLSVPEQLSFYDSGVYLAAAVHLVSGVLPYRDFTFVQPPGLLYVLAPVAVVSRFFGTHDGFMVGRVLSAAVTAANCALTSALVRRHGRVAMIVAGVGLAVSPVAFFEGSAIKLEPYCLIFVLGAALIVTGRGPVGTLTRRRAILAGVTLGVAGLVKLWAFFPFLAIVAIVGFRARSRVVPLVVAAGATFLAGVAPYLVAAPRAFLSEVFVEQLGRKATVADSGSILWRVRALTGYIDTLVSPTALVALVALALLGLVAIVAFRRWRETSDEDAFFLVGSVAVVVMLLTSPETYNYYYYFAQPFLVGLATVSVWNVGSRVGRGFPRPTLTRGTRRFLIGATVTGLVITSGALALYSTSDYSAYAYVYGIYGPWMDPIARIIPAGDCVVYTEVAYGVFENRLTSSDPRCPAVVDVYGQWLANGYELVAPPPSFSATWKGYFERAAYVVFPWAHPGDVPWNASLDAWFSRHFRLVYDENGVAIYRARVGG